MCWYCIKKGHNVDKCENYDKITNKKLGKKLLNDKSFKKKLLNL